MLEGRRSLLFLIGNTGGGHRASAEAVSHYLERDRPREFAVQILDPFEADPTALSSVVALYSLVTRRLPRLWGGIYHATNSRAAVQVMYHSLLRRATPVVRATIDELCPQAVVSFHPLLNHVAVDATRRRGRGVTPVITVVTDLVDIHSTWICGGVDSILTPLSQQAKHLVRMGVPADRVHSLGLSVDRAFTLPPCGPEAKAELRRRLGLARERVCVLVCGGADGSGKLDATARAIVDAGVDAELVVVCGRNQNVRDGLMGLRHADGRAVHVRGFVNNMSDFMHAADVIVTKAGPATISEALCCGLPMLITWYVPGQERGNVAWVVEAGAGRYVARPDELVKSLKALLVPGSQAIRDMSEAAQSAARPLAAGAVGEFIARSARAADFQVEEDHVSGSLPSGRERLCARPDYRSAL